MEPAGLADYLLGDIKKPIDTVNFNWYAFVCISMTLTIRNTFEPLGGMFMKERQLKAIGYTPILVS